MRVLVACEFSGIVREAFAARGHDAWSCDLLPSERPGQHIQGDVLEILEDGWDLMIAHPPCTHLAVSGARWFKNKQAEQADAIAFFMALTNAPAPRICVENPIGIMSTKWRRPNQIIQPYQFGHDASKSTCLWLKGLPLLTPTRFVEPHYGCPTCKTRFDGALGKYGCPTCHAEPKPAKQIWGNQTPSGQNALGPSERRWAERSITYQGIADAMAEQWGGLTMPDRRPCETCGTPTWLERRWCGPGCRAIYAEWLMHVLLEGQED